MFGRKKDGERTPGQPATGPVGDDELDALLMRSASRKQADAPGSGPAPAAAAQETPRRATPPPPVPAAGPTRPPAPTPSSGGEGRKLIVGRDICLKGEVTSCDTVIVEGNVELSHTDARHVQVAAGGVFSGTVDVEEADIAGRFEGELVARDRLIVRSGGVVTGRVRYANIVIEAGGHIAGEVAHMGDVAEPATPPTANPEPNATESSDDDVPDAVAFATAMPAAPATEPEQRAEPASTPKTAIERAAVPLPPRMARHVTKPD